jgi:hypothetical protein
MSVSLQYLPFDKFAAKFDQSDVLLKKMAGEKILAAETVTNEKAMVEDFSKWGVQTSFGLATGFVLGFVKGFRESSHLAGKYGPDSVYRGYWASFRSSFFPLEFLQVVVVVF